MGPPGKNEEAGSGFHMKGNAYRGLQDFVEHTVPGGMKAVAERLPNETRAFFEQSFAAGSWYDVLPVEDITRACASAASVPHDEICRRFGESTLERDRNGIYRALLRFATADLLVRALPYTTKRYFDFVSLAVTNLEPGSYRVVVSGVPRSIASTYIGITTVFIVRAIEGAGASNVRTTTTTPQPAGMKHGRPMVRFERHLRWDA